METRYLATTDEALALISSIGGRIFSATFVKKDGSERTMLARRGVTRHLAGGEMRYDAIARGLLPVFDMDNVAYRMVNLATLKEIRVNGIRYMPSYFRHLG